MRATAGSEQSDREDSEATASVSLRSVLMHGVHGVIYYKEPCSNVARDKRRGKRRTDMSRYLRGEVTERLDIGSLASKVAIKTDFSDPVVERFRVSSLVATYSMDDFTKGADKGPILVGIAHSDYLVSEIEQFVEQLSSWDDGDLSEQEVAGRLIRKIGVFNTPEVSGVSVSLNDGRPIKTKLNWSLRTAQTLALWAYNLGNGAVATTSPQIYCVGHANLWRM